MRVARTADYTDQAPGNGPTTLPPLPGPAFNGPPGMAQPPPGVYPPGPPLSPPVANPPPVTVPGQRFQDATELLLPIPTVGPEAPAAGANPSEKGALLPSGSDSVYRLLDHLEVTGVARGYFRNDQRIEWSGMEDTFGAEGIIAPRLRQQCGDFEFLIDSEFYINEPYNRNQLLDDRERRSYAANFQVDTFEVSQLALVTKYQDWTFKIGKFVTPFGRYYFPLYTNAEWDAPFIRADVIAWRQTGILMHYKSGFFVGDIALTDGGENLGTNSSKSLVARIGLESEFWAVGCSARKGGGSGSEIDKEFENYYGADMMVRNGPFQISSECIFDQYGFGRPGLDPMDITWVKSIYYRDVSSGQQGVPCTGIGYYVNFGYADGPWDIGLSYGDFHPLDTGTAPNQRVVHRGLAKVAYQIARPLQVYSVLLVENGGYIAQENRARKSLAVLEGFQYTF